jgi:hypothetical protein
MIMDASIWMGMIGTMVIVSIFVEKFENKKALTKINKSVKL